MASQSSLGNSKKDTATTRRFHFSLIERFQRFNYLFVIHLYYLQDQIRLSVLVHQGPRSDFESGGTD